MEKYKIYTHIGAGSFATVIKAQNIQTNEIVAIKKMKKKFTSWDECVNLREIKSLRKMNHPNIIKLKEVIQLYYKLNLFIGSPYNSAKMNYILISI